MMNFLFPTFLIGLLAIAIPIIIHLFNFRKYKKVYFTNVQFLKELKQESDSKSKLKEWLILTCRILTIACLVIAFAQPFIVGKNKLVQGNKAISVFIDNSFSMDNTNKKGTLLENAKQHATEIINSFNATDTYQLLTNNFEGKHQRFLSKEEFLEQLNEVKITSATRNINEILKRQQNFLQNNNSKNKYVFVLSDFQKINSLLNKNSIDTTIAINFVPIQSTQTNNVFVDSVWFKNPAQQFNTQQQINASIVNKSNKAIENGTLKLIINGKQVSLASFNISSNSKQTVSISFLVKEKEVNNCSLKIEDYPITYDDEFYFTFNAKTIINALVINGNDTKTASNFKSLLQKDSLFNYYQNTEASIDYSLFIKTNLIILNELTALSSGLTTELKKFTLSGGSVIIFPNQKIDNPSYNTAFTILQLPQIINLDTTNTKIKNINFEQGLYEGVFEKTDERMDMPKIMAHYVFKNTTNSNLQKVIQLQNNNSFLSEHQLGSGKIYLFATPSSAQATSFLKHALFVPTIIKIAILSIKPTPIYYSTSSNQAIIVSAQQNFSEKPLHLINLDKSIDVIPEHRLTDNGTTLFTQNQITQAGYYLITDNTTPIKNTAFNFDRKESDMNFLSNNDLQKQLDETGLKNITIVDAKHNTIRTQIQNGNDEKKLWKLFLILALVFLLTEILIIRILK